MAFVASLVVYGTPPAAHALVRDSVQISLQGQTRVLRLVSDDAHVERGMACGADPTGVTLVGNFRLEMIRPGGSVCGRLELGRLALDHGDGWDGKKVLLLGDYNGDGHTWEVAFAGTGGVSNGHGRSIAGYDAVKGRLWRYRFRRSSYETDDVLVSRYPASLRWSDGHLQVRYYTNQCERPPYGWVAELYSFDHKLRLFTFVRTVQDQEPDSWPEWPLM